LVSVGELRRRGRKRRTYCHCAAGEEPNSVWIGCEMCDEWYRPPCVGLGDLTKHQVKLHPLWVCDDCKPLCDQVAPPSPVEDELDEDA
jgi:hypothetical protein